MTDRRDERGMALSVFVAIGIVFLIIVVGIGVDATGQVGAQQDARNIAQQAARAAAQQLRFENDAATLDPTRAMAAANAYLASSGYASTVTFDGRSTLTITVRGTWPTKFLGLIGITTLPVTGTATADALATSDGRPR